MLGDRSLLPLGEKQHVRERVRCPPAQLRGLRTRTRGLAPLRMSTPASQFEWMLLSAIRPPDDRRRNIPDALQWWMSFLSMITCREEEKHLQFLVRRMRKKT